MIDVIIYKLRSFRIHSQVDSHMDPLHPVVAPNQGAVEPGMDGATCTGRPRRR